MQQPDEFGRVIRRDQFDAGLGRRQFEGNDARQGIHGYRFQTFNGLVRAPMIPFIFGIRCSATPF